VRVVIDTNVLISGVFFNGAPYQVLQAWRNELIEVVISPEIMSEYQRVGEIFAREKPGVDLTRILDYVFQNALFFETPELLEPVCTDPEDDKFIACALASGSKIIVSGDKHLLRVSGYHSIDVFTPREFLSKYSNLSFH
jgi:putative PIN family toxin of toxin-antitoxin system